MDFHVIEVPPLALVILKGDLHPNMPGMGAEPARHKVYWLRF